MVRQIVGWGSVYYIFGDIIVSDNDVKNFIIKSVSWYSIECKMIYDSDIEDYIHNGGDKYGTCQILHEFLQDRNMGGWVEYNIRYDEFIFHNGDSTYMWIQARTCVEAIKMFIDIIKDWVFNKYILQTPFEPYETSEENLSRKLQTRRMTNAI